MTDERDRLRPRIVELRHDGLSQREIAEKLGLNVSTVRNWLAYWREHGIEDLPIRQDRITTGPLVGEVWQSKRTDRLRVRISHRTAAAVEFYVIRDGPPIVYHRTVEQFTRIMEGPILLLRDEDDSRELVAA